MEYQWYREQAEKLQARNKTMRWVYLASAMFSLACASLISIFDRPGAALLSYAVTGFFLVIAYVNERLIRRTKRRWNL